MNSRVSGDLRRHNAHVTPLQWSYLVKTLTGATNIKYYNLKHHKAYVLSFISRVIRYTSKHLDMKRIHFVKPRASKFQAFVNSNDH